MHKIYLLFFILIAHTKLFSQSGGGVHTQKQQHKPENRLLASFGPQYYFNQYNPMEYTGTTNIATLLKTKNTTCTYLRLGYERTTRYGLTFGAGLVGGSYKYDFTVYRDFSDFDPRATRALKGVIYDTNITATKWYIAPEITVGYRYRLNDNWTLSAKAGAFIKYRLTNKEMLPPTAVLLALNYPTDDGAILIRARDVMSYNIFDHITNTKVAHLYLGAEHTINYRYFHHFTFGLDFTQNIIHPLSAYAVTWENFSAFQQMSSTARLYHAKDFTIALCLGVSLWP